MSDLDKYQQSNADNHISLSWDEFQKCGEIANNAENVLFAAEYYQTQCKTITKQRDELVELFEGLERVTDIWIPSNVDNDHIGEAECLHRFRGEYLRLLSTIKGQKDAE